MASNYNVAATSLIVTDWQFDVRKGESWQENSIFCQGLNLGLKETGQVQHTDTGNHISQAVIMEHEVPTNQEDSDDYVSLLEQLELAMSETPEESNDKVINIEHRKETALTNSGQGDHNKGSDRGKITEARVASNEGPAFSTDEKFVVVSATSSSSASQENEKTTDEAEVAWSSWMGM